MVISVSKKLTLPLPLLRKKKKKINKISQRAWNEIAKLLNIK